jgi:hypothetical protein
MLADQKWRCATKSSGETNATDWTMAQLQLNQWYRNERLVRKLLHWEAEQI